MPIIIDGYNLLRAIQKSDENFPDLSEAGLCRILSVYLKGIRTQGLIVFDGSGPPDGSCLDYYGNLRVIFSGHTASADDVIEHKITENTAPKRLAVISTDRRIRTAAGRRKAPSIRADEFWAIVVSKIEKQKKPVREPPGKRQGITPAETDHWLDYFGLKG